MVDYQGEEGAPVGPDGEPYHRVKEDHLLVQMENHLPPGEGGPPIGPDGEPLTPGDFGPGGPPIGPDGEPYLRVKEVHQLDQMENHWPPGDFGPGGPTPGARRLPQEKHLKQLWLLVYHQKRQWQSC